MKKFLSINLLLAFLVIPFFVFAATSAGLTPSSPFYFLDTLSEKIVLFFIFNSENKVKKALEYADERLSEAEASIEEKNSNGVEIALTGYKESLSFASAQSKEVKDSVNAENLFNQIASTTSNNEKVLVAVFNKVPEEAKQAITQAIEASKKGQEEAHKQIAELKGEVEQLKQEVAELKKQQKTELIPSQNTDTQSQSTGIKELKKEVEELKKQATEKEEREKTPPIVVIPAATTLFLSPSNKSSCISLVTATHEKHYFGSCNDIPTSTPMSVPTISSISSETLEILSVNILPDITSVKIEWVTNRQSESKLYLSGSGLISKPFSSEAGYTTNHFVNIGQLIPTTDYSFRITATGEGGFVDNSGIFKTKIPAPTLQMIGGGGIPLGRSSFGKISWNTTYASFCTASGNWSGERDGAGEYIPSSANVGNYIYSLTCIGNNGESVSKSVNVNVFNTKPQITFYINDVISNIFSGKVGETVKLRWETSGADSCTASNSWSESKYAGGSQNIILETVGEFSYTLTCRNGNSGEDGTNTAIITVVQ